ncbi:peroxide stress protein YaaA [Clostridium tarantellae]|uniref:UPF0246 protein GBZ86_07460 n=1 Tax=Clostridium tarantellae TaxID=39493 RepID=A0A6I1MLH1_9CLOT|nr:peroxide stress protein YaaA [Clostridium tarantellae]MPQ43593.1 peroxide stress protein YaaA [Clostridium tarantellae]
MIVILSPAKTMDLSKNNLKINTTTPLFLEEADIIMNKLKKLEVHELASLMKINEKLATLNFIRNQDWKKFYGENEKASLFCFNGEVFKGLNAKEFSDEDLKFCNDHLRILSALYGMLRPLDGIKPYRLEMGTKISINNKKNLYDFWSEKLTSKIIDEVKKDNEKILINLASEEYYKVLDIKHDIRQVNIMFKERKGYNYKIITIYAKKARGLMVNYIVKNRIDNLETLKNFNEEGYVFNEILSDWNNLIFTRE